MWSQRQMNLMTSKGNKASGPVVKRDEAELLRLRFDSNSTPISLCFFLIRGVTCLQPTQKLLGKEFNQNKMAQQLGERRTKNKKALFDNRSMLNTIRFFLVSQKSFDSVQTTCYIYMASRSPSKFEAKYSPFCCQSHIATFVSSSSCSLIQLGFVPITEC